MSEATSSQYELERYKLIRKAVETADNLGIKKTRQRRELVINAKNFISRLNAPWISSEEADNFPSLAKENPRDESPNVKNNGIDKYFKIKMGNADVPIVVECLHGHSEIKTAEITSRVAERLGGTTLIAKKDRSFTDPNRSWWMGVKKNEYSRSVRAAMFWSYDMILSKLNLLNDEFKLIKNTYRLSIHGMVDGNGFDIAIAAGYNPADIKKIERLRDLIQQKMMNYRVEIVDGKHPKASSYSGYESLSSLRREPKMQEDKHHPAFGMNLQTFQIEISKRLRTNRKNRKQITNALVYAMKEIQNED